MVKKLAAFLIFFLFVEISHAYESVYFADEENSLRYIVRDYSFINSYNTLWAHVAESVDLTIYDDFINKDFSKMPPKQAREEAINFIINYKVKLDFENNGEMLQYPVTNSLVLQNKALLKARKVLDELPIHEKTSLVYLAAGISYLKSDGLYELEKLQKIFKEWLRLGAEDFKHISSSDKLNRKRFFTYIANMKSSPDAGEEFINIIVQNYYEALFFKKGYFDLFNTQEYIPIDSNEISPGKNYVEYYISNIKAEYMDIVSQEPFRLNMAGKDVNHYFSVWDRIDNANRIRDNFYIFPFNKQTFVIFTDETEDEYIFRLNYYNPRYISKPEFAKVTVSKNDNQVKSEILWSYNHSRGRVVNPLTATPSFVCSDDLPSQKVAICESFTLRMLDKISSSKYYSLYSSIKNRPKKKYDINKIRQDFQDNLNSCYIDKDCMKQAYENYLDKMLAF